MLASRRVLSNGCDPVIYIMGKIVIKASLLLRLCTGQVHRRFSQVEAMTILQHTKLNLTRSMFERQLLFAREALLGTEETIHILLR